MTRSALVRRRRALRGALLLVSASALASCSLRSGHGDGQPDPQRSPTSQAEGGQVGAEMATTASPHNARRPRGRRGTGCSVKNDCQTGLSCVRGLCEQASFGLTPSGKECVQVDCIAADDCCGNLPADAPEKCRARAFACTKDLPGCETKACTRSSECAGGGVCTGHCLISSGECSGNVDCLANKCLGGSCSINFTSCNSDAECAANTCSGGSCACENPGYAPASPLCTDPECDGLCLWACEGSRCVIPSACSSDDDCFGSKPVCIEGGCVECAQSADCSFDKVCRAGSCESPCQDDTNCALFEACQTGECIYVGCRSDRECSLIPDVNALELAPGFDPRLLRCHSQAGVGKCVIPCQTDAQCAATETCAAGLCSYIGCESSSECKSILDIHDQVPSAERPWVPVLYCRAVEDAGAR